MRPSLLPLIFLMRVASIGIRVCAISKEARRATIMVKPICFKNKVKPLSSPKTIGANTITEVMVPAVMAKEISLTALRVAAIGSSIIWRFLKIFSVTTTLLSTSIPMASIKPIKVKIFKL